MTGPKKRRSSETEEERIVEKNLGHPFCTPNGLAIVSAPLYHEYRVPEENHTIRFRHLVHCQGSEWWLSRSDLSALGISNGWIFTDQPPRQWSCDVVHRVEKPTVYPFLHRRGCVLDLRDFRAHFLSKLEPRELMDGLLRSAGNLFHMHLSDVLTNNLDCANIYGEFFHIQMLIATPSREICSQCHRNHLIVCTHRGNKLCNACARRKHAAIKFCSRVPISLTQRQSPLAFMAFVDCCLTIEENFQRDPIKVLDYSRP